LITGMRRGGAVVVVLLVGLIAAAVAFAAPPSNDNRADATVIEIPSETNGTTAEATLEPSEPAACQTISGSVWYRVTIPAKGTLDVALKADGDLDATLEVFKARRSQLSASDCQVSDDQGEASSSLRVAANEIYYVRVGQLQNSVAGTFTLSLQFTAPTPRAPGAPLPGRGASGRVHPVVKPAAAYSKTLRAGTPYRLSIDGGGRDSCPSLDVYPPGTRDFDDDEPVRTLSCGGYRLFAPGPGDGGRYSFVVRAARSPRSNQPFRLQVAPATNDDTDPGIFIRNYATVKGKLSAPGGDRLDIYRFDVTRRSDLDLVLSTNAGIGLSLLRDSGHTLASGSKHIRRRLSRGRYYAIVEADAGEAGSYTLRRISRTITRTRVAINGRRRLTVAPGRTVNIGVNVSPSVSGTVAIIVYKHDPIEGWQFTRSFRRHLSGGRASVPFHLPDEGRWRARARFYGTRQASESRTGAYAFVTAQRPLSEKR
jgi:hypothetical protein